MRKNGSPIKQLTKYLEEHSIPIPAIISEGKYPEKRNIRAKSLVPIPLMVIGIIPIKSATGTKLTTNISEAFKLKIKKNK
tara:strand:- start:101 stop:340 length:240 start_codon:yes stop_codon:yes gene_type:complete